MGDGKKKKAFFGKHAKSSAALVSIGIHAGLILIAISFVAVRVYVKDDQTFEDIPVNRPKMQLRKLTVPVIVKKKKAPKPKLRRTIVSKPKTKSMDIQLPEISGVKGGTGYGAGDGLGGIGFGIEFGLFGADKGTGNEFEGTFFDLKMKPDGSPAKMDEDYYKEVVRNFASSWTVSRLEKRYFQAPNKKFATMFMMPNMKAEEAPKAYGVGDVVKPKQWVAYYHGKIAAPETGRYRFWGIGDDVLMVRVKKRLVIDANLPDVELTDWTSDDHQDKKYKMSEQLVRVGDWFHLTKGKPVDMEVLIGERPGALFCCHLLIEQDGIDYPKGKDGRPLLPIFKTVDVPPKLLPKMKIEAGTCTTEGPNFGVMR